jgi:hypothetical protein
MLQWVTLQQVSVVTKDSYEHGKTLSLLPSDLSATAKGADNARFTSTAGQLQAEGKTKALFHSHCSAQLPSCRAATARFQYSGV